jgi:hypothetical protein
MTSLNIFLETFLRMSCGPAVPLLPSEFHKSQYEHNAAGYLQISVIGNNKGKVFPLLK